MRTIVTSGYAYCDIDVFASAIACQELLQKQGYRAQAVLQAPFNSTIPNIMQKWPVEYKSQYLPSYEQDRFVLVDISDPAHFEKFVDHSRIDWLYDHHSGYENYWMSRLGSRCHIEYLGSCSTLIWEQFIKFGLYGNISSISANLLYTSIFANTLNFLADVTHDRDILAFQQLSEYASLPKDWISIYYQATDSCKIDDLKTAILRDTKTLKLGRTTYRIAQLELWDAKDVVHCPGFIGFVEDLLTIDIDDYWFLTVACISENKNYLITSHHQTQRELMNVLGVCFQQKGIASTEKIILRKEIIKAYQTDFSAHQN